MRTFRFLILTAVLATAMVSCNNPNKEWASNPENDRIVHICGTIDNFSFKSVRICSNREEIIHFDNGAYYEIRVKDGRFSADVPLDPDKAYEFIVPFHKSYASIFPRVFFADQDTIRIAYDTQSDSFMLPEILNPEGNNKEYQLFLEERESLFADLRVALKKERLSYSDEYMTVQRQLNDKTLDEYAQDSIVFVLAQMEEDGTAFTTEGRRHLEKEKELNRKEVDYAWDYLASRPPSLAMLEVVYESMRIASKMNYGFSSWHQYYNRVYADKFKDCNLHQSINGIISAMAIHEGMHFIDFTLPDKDGQEQTLSQLIDGKYAILEFWATWCVPCITTRHTIKDLYDRYKDKGFTVVEVAREFRNDSKWRSFIEKDGADWTDLLAMEDKHSVGDAYGLKHKAGSYFLIDKEGTIIKINPTNEEMEAILAGL